MTRVAPGEPSPRTFIVESVNGVVQAGSVSRLAFEPRGWQVAFRAAIRWALAALRSESGCIVAELHTPDDDLFDVENTLLYNVGTAAFAKLARRGLAFRRLPDVLGTHPASSAPYRVLARYEPVAELPAWFRGSPRGTMSFRLPRLSSSTKPHAVWHAASVGTISGSDAIPKDFGLEVRISTPRRAKCTLAGVVKPLLDGVISALHTHEDDGAGTSMCIDRLAALTRVDAATMRSLLCGRTTWTPLGRTSLVRLRSQGIQWNPSDHRCTAVVIRQAAHDDADVAVDVRVFAEGSFASVETGFRSPARSGQ